MRYFKPSQLARKSAQAPYGEGIIPLSYFNIKKHIDNKKLKAVATTYQGDKREYNDYMVSEDAVREFLEERADDPIFKKALEKLNNGKN